MKDRRIVRVILLLIMLLLGTLVVMYYWSNDTLESLVIIPKKVLFFVLGYILVQILKRSLSREKKWWDWLYYIALLGILLPTVLADESNASIFHILADYGTLFLIIPVLIDGKKLIDAK